MALGQLVSSHPRNRSGPAIAGQLAGAAGETVVRAGESTSKRGGNGRDSRQPGTWPALRRRAMADEGHATARARAHPPPARSPTHPPAVRTSLNNDPRPLKFSLSLANAHPHAVLARPPSHGRHGARVPGSIQIVSDCRRRALAGRAAVRGVQSAARGWWLPLNGGAGQLVSSHPRNRSGQAIAGQFAGAAGETVVCRVNRPQSEAEMAAIRASVARGRPYGGAQWQTKVARQFGLEHTLRPRGRPASTRSPNQPKQ